MQKRTNEPTRRMEEKSQTPQPAESHIERASRLVNSWPEWKRNYEADMALLFEENRHAFGRTFEKEALALLARYGQTTEPEGWQLVPKEATPEMVEQGVLEAHGYEAKHRIRMFYQLVYEGMLKAAPKFGEEQ